MQPLAVIQYSASCRDCATPNVCNHKQQFPTVLLKAMLETAQTNKCVSIQEYNVSWFVMFRSVWHAVSGQTSSSAGVFDTVYVVFETYEVFCVAPWWVLHIHEHVRTYSVYWRMNLAHLFCKGCSKTLLLVRLCITIFSCTWQRLAEELWLRLLNAFHLDDKLLHQRSIVPLAFEHLAHRLSGLSRIFGRGITGRSISILDDAPPQEDCAQCHNKSTGKLVYASSFGINFHLMSGMFWHTSFCWCNIWLQQQQLDWQQHQLVQPRCQAAFSS